LRTSIESCAETVTDDKLEFVGHSYEDPFDQRWTPSDCNARRGACLDSNLQTTNRASSHVAESQSRRRPSGRSLRSRWTNQGRVRLPGRTLRILATGISRDGIALRNVRRELHRYRIFRKHAPYRGSVSRWLSNCDGH